jgi:BON domain
MDRLVGLLGGMGLGAGLMFLLDPDRGRRRRAAVRDKAIAANRRLADRTAATLEDASNRARGIVAEARSLWSAEPVPDDLLTERVRARLGQVCARPRDVVVDVHDGRVVLHGAVADDEYDRVLRRVRWTPGVQAVEHDLTVRAEPHPPQPERAARWRKRLGDRRLLGAGMGLAAAAIGGRRHVSGTLLGATALATVLGARRR